MTREFASVAGELADGAARFAAANFGAARYRALRNQPLGLDLEALARAGADGWLAALAPEKGGGMGQGLVEAAAIATAFGRALAPFPYPAIAAASLAAGQIAATFGDAARDAVLSGKCIVAPAFAWGASTLRLDTTADGYRLSGAAKGVHGAPAADYLMVEAMSRDGTALAFIEAKAAGVGVASARAVDGSLVGDLSFADCAVTPRAMVAGEAAARLRDALAILCAADLVGAMEAALDITLEHIKTRTQFGRPLAAFQALQFRTVDAYIGLALSREMVNEAARLFDADNPSRGFMAAAVKAKAGEAARELARAMVQLHGAIGFTDEHDIGLYLKRALTYGAAWGTAADHRARVAASAGQGEVRFREESPEDQAFRLEVRDWLKQNLPEHLKHLPTRPSHDEALWWHKKLAARGWIAPHWPKKYGGMEATVAQQIVLFEEFAAIGAPEISGQAISHLGPILQAFGTPEQKAQHLPNMLSGETTWCQGYSEPGAGSDLASLRTRAVRDGDHFVINGSKIWTTWGQYADWMFALVRTNPDVKKQAGITFILLDMKTSGVTRRPIETIAGDDEFAEVFFDDVRVPVSNVVGAIDDGWRVATALLEKERLNGANPRKCADILSKIRSAIAGGGVDAGFMDRLTRAEIDYVALCATYARIVNQAETGGKPTADFAFAKLVNAELQQHLCELLVEAFGARGGLEGPIDADGHNIWPGRTYLQSRRTTIHGGTVEIQRGLIARRVLGLA